ncbi:hypothetical protein QNI19_38150 [Cytophagaceae bacterium DM2B3-1]|uniref:Phage tail collar domain-containing protein n=1 Tax=Xanthocytophaga flava TaxID=3048013 RepID=A0ABT7D0P8_9BACT|nr:hypothetical protein [Xanthocytophaga flavus]MDJ1498815.1 hypothetical protein [Xanthocytophaga flavus]
MNKLLIPLYLFFLSFHSLSAQCEYCKDILKEGLYKKILRTRSQNLSSDLKTYFSSEQFETDMKEGDWGATLGVIIDGIPVNLGANSSNQEMTQFRSKIINSKNIQLSQNTYDQLVTALPDVEIAKVYKDCLAECNKKGFKVYTTYSNNDATFIIRYDPTLFGDPMPKVQFFSITNGTNIVNAPKKDDVLSNELIIACNRNPEQDLVLLLQTDRGQTTYRIPAQPSGFNRDLPVGTIISSYLNFQQFSIVTNNNDASGINTWQSQYSKWCPCDGRPVPNSNFQRVTSTNNVPDLRGVFLRALNQFDPNSSTPTNNQQLDPMSGRTVGSYQADEFKSHTHEYNVPHDQGSTYWVRWWGAGDAKALQQTTQASGGDETRPKNIAVYYYIRIN